MDSDGTLNLKTARDSLVFAGDTGSLVSYRSGFAPEQEFIAPAEPDPVCVVQYLDDNGTYRRLDSRAAARTEVSLSEGEIRIRLERIGGMELDVTLTVRAGPEEACSRWYAALDNRAGLRITDIAYPYIVCRYELGGKVRSEALLWPFGPGVLLSAPRPEDLKPDHPHLWQFRPENGDCWHYPGYTVAQFLAYFNDRAGLVAHCEDATGKVKLIQPVHHGQGIRLGMSHVGDWPESGVRALPYPVTLNSFRGDWHAAADVYRVWSLQQPWARSTLATRRDVPDWLLDSPPHIIIRLQGQLDIGPAEPVQEFLPYEKCIPLLEEVSRKIESPVLPVIMSWEKPGPWIYPECFPPVGGESSLRSMAAAARIRGWHVGSFCNGTRWVTGHYWTPYDGEPYYRERGAERSVCRTAAGERWRESWDATWRPSYACCLGADLTNRVAQEFVRTLIDLGLDWIQFFDQNVGCATFACFARDHEHPSVPGSWMTDRMLSLIHSFHGLAEATRRGGDGDRRVVFSVEGPVNEVFLQEIQLCDVRVVPPGHRAGSPGFGGGFVPLYHYLYHEFMVMQGGFGSAPEPYHLPIRNAYNLVIGEIPGAVLQGDGVLLNKDTFNWANWQPVVGRDADSVAMLRSATALRRGPARDHLVFGRMLSPARVRGVKRVRWRHGDRHHEIPSIFHEAWQAPGGRFGVVLANWTERVGKVTLRDPRLSGPVKIHVSGKTLKTRTVARAERGIELAIPPCGCMLVEGASVATRQS